MLYFDHNATTPLLPQAKQAWVEAAEQFIGNPSSPHRSGARADAALEGAREQLAAFLGCDAMDIVWTSGATESNNMIFRHLDAALAADAEALVSTVEHPSVLAAAGQWLGKRVRPISVERSGVVALEWLEQELSRRRVRAVAIMAANNETGVIQPWREARALCRRWEVPLACDGTQWIGKLPALGLGECDFVSGSAHKFGGPRGVGFLKCPSGRPLTPLLVGGSQEEGRRAGTENVPGVLAMLAALTARESALAAGEHQARAPWRDTFERGLLEALPGTEIVGARAKRLWNTVSALMPEADCRLRWVVKLDKAGCAVSTGSACASGREEPSPVLAAMGFSPAEAGRALRFSSGWETTPEDWTRLLAGVRAAHESMMKTKKS